MKKIIRKILPAFLGLSLLFAMLPLTALAEGEEDLVPTIHISDAEDLEQLAENCRLDSWSRGRIVVLDCDIDLRTSSFSGIPTFGGTFEGQGHTIQNIKLEQDGSVQGFFRYIQEGAVVRNLTLSGQISPAGTRADAGGFAGINAGTIENCTFRGIVSGSTRVGGFAGDNTVTGVITGCASNGSIYGNHFVGGVAGQNDGVITNCTNDSTINTTVSQNEVDLGDLTLDDLLNTENASDTTDIGGIAGASAGVIRACVNRGAVGYQHIGYNVGGIAGSQTGYIEGCVNYGTVHARKEAGGIVGQMEPSSILQYTPDTLQILDGQLDTLQTLVDRTCSDAAACSSEVTSQINDLKNRVDEARKAVDTLITNAANGITEGTSTVTITDLTQLTGASGSSGSISGSGEAESSQDASLETGLVPGKPLIPLPTPKPEETEQPEQTTEPTETQEPAQTQEPAEEPTPEPEPAEQSGAEETVTPTEEAGADAGTDVSRAGEAQQRPKRSLPALRTDYEANQSAEGEFEISGDAQHNANGQIDSQLTIEVPSVELTNRDAISAARNSLNGSMASIVDSVGSLNSSSGSYTQALIQDIQDITKQLNKIANTLVGASQDSQDDVFEDISDEDTEGDTEGKVFNCINEGSVQADINAGGITGAMARENDLDPEDDIQVKGSDSLNFTYKRRVVVRDCINNGEVTAKKQCMGGIVGLMDMGTVLACTSYADMDSESADYVGGIAGRSKAVIRQCAVKAKLSGADYVGGIAGSGATVTDCRSLVLTDGNEKVGAVLGGTESGENDLASQSETISGNCFLGSEMGGIDGISYAGQAEPLDYETWKTVTENDGLPETFRTFTLRFVTDEETVAAFTLDYDAAFDRANEPEVPQVSGCTGAWEEYESDAVRFDQTVKAVYTRQSNVLESTDRREDGRAVVLIEGNFGPQDAVTLTLMEDGPDGAAETWQLALPGDGTEPHTVHYLPAETKNSPTILVLGADGNWREVPTGEDGSYLVFNLNAGETTFAEQPSAGIPLPLLIGGLAAALLLCIFAVVSHRKKKRAAVANAK
ncbi:MAG: hypothetical protein PUA63_03640 [Oscillospiraceae bacterium]|nr:hypothetical protein [Oscillospiraceae bacterium]